MKIFSRQPFTFDRKYCTKINYHNIHNYTQACSTHHHKLLHTHMIQHMKKFLSHPVNFARKYCMGGNVIIYTTTHMYASHIIVHFDIQQYLHTRLSQFKNRFHQVGSLYPLDKSYQVDSNINYKFLWLHKRWMCYLATK